MENGGPAGRRCATPVALMQRNRPSGEAPGRSPIGHVALPSSGPWMGLGARTFEVRMFAAFAVRAVTRHVAETVGSLVFSVHAVLLGESADAVAAGASGRRRRGRPAQVATEERPGVPAAAARVVGVAALVV